METKEQKPSDGSSKDQRTFDELLILGHLIKYNLYLLGKSILFAAIYSRASSIRDAVFETNRTMEELDLDLQRVKDLK